MSRVNSNYFILEKHCPDLGSLHCVDMCGKITTHIFKQYFVALHNSEFCISFGRQPSNFLFFHFWDSCSLYSTVSPQEKKLTKVAIRRNCIWRLPAKPTVTLDFSNDIRRGASGFTVLRYLSKFSSVFRGNDFFAAVFREIPFLKTVFQYWSKI